LGVVGRAVGRLVAVGIWGGGFGVVVGVSPGFSVVGVVHWVVGPDDWGGR